MEVAKQIKEALNHNSFVELMKADDIHQAVKDVALLMIHLVLTDGELKEEIKKVVHIPVEDITSVKLYIDALKSSGVDDIRRGMLMVLGNSSVGKSSLMRTIQNYCEGKPRENVSFLTQNSPFLETQVVEVI